MKTISPNLLNSNAVKLQGVAYYTDCYNFWDINKCLDKFESPLYDNIIDQISQGTHPLYNGLGNMAVINLDVYERGYLNYYNQLSKNVRRDIEKCRKHGFYMRQYDFNEFVHDFSSINFSQATRKGTINPWYLQDTSKFTGSHSGGAHKWENETHYTRWYGLFKYLKNYKQGDAVTNKRLYGYCKVAVEGELASIHLVFGHADHFRCGVMFALLTSVIEEVMRLPNVKFLAYYGYPTHHAHKAEGIWKSRMLFEPCKIRVKL